MLIRQNCKTIVPYNTLQNGRKVAKAEERERKEETSWAEQGHTRDFLFIRISPLKYEL